MAKGFNGADAFARRNLGAKQAFHAITGVSKPEDDDTVVLKNHGAETPNMAEPTTPTPAAFAETEPPAEVRSPIVPRSGRRPKPENAIPKYVHKSYYITKEHVQALKRRAYFDDGLDLSGHLRAALDQYLADDLEALRKER